MIDQYGRTVDYMRISITDRCNLRCKYCMPDGISLGSPDDMLCYEEILRLCRIAVSLGITTFKVTGGEPLVRRGCVDFIARLKVMNGVEQVTLTTNGLLLAEHLDALCDAGIDGVNISIDTLCEEAYRALTGSEAGAVNKLRQTLEDCVRRGLRVKVNTVLLAQVFAGIHDLAGLAAKLPVDVRFIELMPIGEGAYVEGVPVAAALEKLKERWPDLAPTRDRRGNGPARYYASQGLQGHIGFIDAMSRRFCGACNRVRLMGTGVLKPCLCYEMGTDLRALMRSGCADIMLREAMAECIERKPRAHCFSVSQGIAEPMAMNRIGG